MRCDQLSSLAIFGQICDPAAEADERLLSRPDRKIVDMLPDRAPQVTFTCDIPSETCGFQFWIGRVESFYCGLSNCTTRREVQYGANTTEYRCEKVECACIPGKMLCGENGSVGEPARRSCWMSGLWKRSKLIME